MDRIILVAIVALATLSLLAAFDSEWTFTGLFVGFGTAQPSFEWWNASWHYRFMVNVSTGPYDRTDWVVERDINFTDYLPFGTFDNNSIRVIEYNSSGGIVREVPSQFDRNYSYSNTSNAQGTLSFIVNNTVAANQNKIYMVYYDIAANGLKPNPFYSGNIIYGTDGNEFQFNNTMFHWRVDTERGELTSGIYRVRGLPSQNDVLQQPVASNVRTYEYVEYSNGSHNFSFDFNNNYSLKYFGPVRFVVEQQGYEVVWNSTNRTYEGFMTKTYTVYNQHPWIRIDTNYTNINTTPVTRNSTLGGAITLDAARAFGSNWQSGFGNTTHPGWWFASDQFSSFHAGVIQYNNTSSYAVTNSSGGYRIGVGINATTVPAGGWMREQTVWHFNDTTGDFTQIRGLRDRFINDVGFVVTGPEQQYVNISGITNASVYNRNETALITANISGVNDLYNVTRFMNATVDMGTGTTADDQTVALFDDGTNGDAAANDRMFTNRFPINNTSTVGVWTVNLTAYNNNTMFLNSSLKTFNVTTEYNITIFIVNDRPVINTQVVANVDVRNYRKDAYVVNPETFQCQVVGQLEVQNKTDLNNGTFSINFTASGIVSTYTLACNATKVGNFGLGNRTFTTEVGGTILYAQTTPLTPSVGNVNFSAGAPFDVVSNVTNIGQGTGYATNTTFDLLAGWSANSTNETCGDLSSASYCTRGFRLTTPANASAGNYTLNVTVSWRNPDNSVSVNRTPFNVTIQSNPLVNASEVNFTGTAGDGSNINIGNFTTKSDGNAQITTVNFTCPLGTACSNFTVNFTPFSVAAIDQGQNQSVRINVTVPMGYPPGTYNGTVNVSAQNDGWDTFVLYVIVPAKTNVSVNASISTYTANTVTQTQSETMQFGANATNTGNGTAAFTNLTVTLPSGWSANSSLEQCGNLTSNQRCQRGFLVTIPAATSPASYLVNLSAVWMQPDGVNTTNTTSINVTVNSNPAINVSETSVAGMVLDGQNASLGSFTVASVGNGAITGVSFNCTSGDACGNFTLNFNPPSISSVAAGTNQSVTFNVTVPLRSDAGNYTGTVNVTTGNDGWDSFTLSVNVPENRSWTVSPSTCTAALQVEAGTVCDVNVSNNGNTNLTVNVTPASANLTSVNDTNFTINKSQWRIVRVSYNTSGQPAGVYNASYTFDAFQAGALPNLTTVNVSLIPFTPPILNMTVEPNVTYQSNPIIIRVNVTDRSGTGISLAKLNLTRPNGTQDFFNMSLISASGNLSRYELTYPNGTNGNNTMRGNYTFVMWSRDSIGNEANITGWFLIHVNLSLTVSTLSSTYFQGDTGSIYFVSRNMSGVPLQNTTANFTIRDPTNNITYQGSNTETNADGGIVPNPTFSLPSDTPAGTYTLIANARYNDTEINRLVYAQRNSTFTVSAGTVSVSGLFADITTAVVWYPNNIMRFGILVYNGEGQPTTPTAMNLTIYDPAGAIYHTASLASMTQQATGYYNYQLAMPVGTSSGMYLATLNVTQSGFNTYKLQAFRVAAGGPYDLRIFLTQPEISPGQNLPFTINVENKGEVTQDVFLEYWVSQGNTTYSSFSEALLTPGFSNQTFARNIFIFNNQPQGTYLLNAKMAYSSVEPQILVNKTFQIVGASSGSAAASSGAASSGGGESTIVVTDDKNIPAQLLISRYSNNVTVARGFAKIENVVVTNIGDTTLNNITLFLLGVNPEWYKISPSSYRSLEPGNSTIFIVTYDVPKTAATGEFPANILASSGVVSDQKRIVVTVLQSIQELLKVDIRRLTDEYQDLQVDLRVARIQGKDVAALELILEQLDQQITNAEDLVETGKTQQALDAIRSGRNLVDKAKDIRDKMEIKDQNQFVIPLDLLAYVGGGAGGIGGLLFFLWRKKKLPIDKIRPAIAQLGKVTEAIKEKKEVRVAAENKERERLQRMLEVLDKERDERIISLSAYNEMRKSIEKKLEALKK